MSFSRALAYALAALLVWSALMLGRDIALNEHKVFTEVKCVGG